MVKQMQRGKPVGVHQTYVRRDGVKRQNSQVPFAREES